MKRKCSLCGDAKEETEFRRPTEKGKKVLLLQGLPEILYATLHAGIQGEE